MRASFLPVLLLASFAASAAESPVPERYPIDRYEKMLDQSPFALATPQAEAPPAPKDNWANNYVLSGLAKYPDDNGVPQWLVVVESRDKREQFSLFGDEQKDGFTIASVEVSPLSRKSSVMLKKGNEPGQIKFMEEPEQAPPQMPVPGMQRPGQPGGMVIPGAQPPALGANRVPGGNQNGRIALPRPNMPNPAPAGAVPRPGAVPQPQAAPLNGATTYSLPAGTGAQPAVPSPRRVRVISSPQ